MMSDDVENEQVQVDCQITDISDGHETVTVFHVRYYKIITEKW